MKIENKKDVAGLIDQTLLRPDATQDDIIRFCKEAGENGFSAVCVHPFFVSIAKETLENPYVSVATVIGFPLGASMTRIKRYEAKEAVRDGADELDIVMNQGLAKSGKWGEVKQEISEIVTETPDIIHKVIIETCNLTDDEKKRAALTVMESGVRFVKTSTGFGAGGATIEDVQLIKSVTKGKVGIKASGGIKTLKDVLSFVEAGATRIGTSSGVSIIKEAQEYFKS
jgi:deoxyribose-phosphate aldolase